MKIVFKLRLAKGPGICSADLLFSRVVEMPYVPPVGMDVIEGDWCVKVDSLTYADGVTFAFVADDKVFRDRSPEEMDELERLYLAEGWQKSNKLLDI